MSAKTIALKGYMEQRGRLLERIDLIRARDPNIYGWMREAKIEEKEQEELRERNHQILVGEIDKIDRATSHLTSMALRRGPRGIGGGEIGKESKQPRRKGENVKCPKCGKDLKCAECGNEFTETEILFQGPTTNVCPFLSKVVPTSLGGGHGTSHSVLNKIPCLETECKAWELTGGGRCKLIEG